MRFAIVLSMALVVSASDAMCQNPIQLWSTDATTAALLADGRLIICPPSKPPVFVRVGTGESIGEVWSAEHFDNNGIDRLTPHTTLNIVCAAKGTGVVVYDMDAAEIRCQIEGTVYRDDDDWRYSVDEIDPIAFLGDTAWMSISTESSWHVVANHLSWSGLIWRPLLCEDERIHRMGRGQTFVEVTFTPGYKSRRHTSISSDASVLVVVNYDRFSEPLVSHVFVGTEVPGTESLLTQLRLGGSATVIGGNRVAAARANGMEIYDAATGFVVDTWDLGFQLDPLVADLNSTEVFAWADGRLYLVDVGEKVIRFDVAHSSRPYRVIVTKDNRHFLTISLDSTVAMYEVQGPVTVDDDLQTTPSVQISPNPASSTLRISSSSTMRIVRMIDMMGEQVFSMTGHSTEFLIEQLGRFAAGLYVLFVETDHGAVSELIGIYR